MEGTVREEFDYFEAHEQELVEQYLDKYVVIKDHNVQGAFDTMDEAYSFASEAFEEGTYLIQQCLKERETQVFHSRAYL